MIEDAAISNLTFYENLNKLDNDYDEFVLLLYLIGWKQKHIAEQLGQTKQAIQYIITKCKKKMEIEI